jgi:hypothetical protein
LKTCTILCVKRILGKAYQPLPTKGNKIELKPAEPGKSLIKKTEERQLNDDRSPKYRMGARRRKGEHTPIP